jgi:hypothetical protein
MTVLKDALYNLHPDSGSSPEYAKGVLVGAVSAIMEVNNRDWPSAIKLISHHLPHKVTRDAVPLSWRGQLAVLGANYV